MNPRQALRNKALHKRALRGYSRSGLVGKTSAVRRVLGVAPAAAAKTPSIVINAGAITVNGAPGADPAANAELARQIVAEQEKVMRGLIKNELNRQRRPGGLLR